MLSSCPNSPHIVKKIRNETLLCHSVGDGSCYAAHPGPKLAMWETYAQSLRDFDSLLFVDQAPCAVSCVLMGQRVECSLE